MNERLDRLLRLLDLTWSDSQLAAALFPFQLVDQLDEGAMALVFQATCGDGTPVIVKMPSPADGPLLLSSPVEYDIDNRIEALRYEAEWLETAVRHDIEGVVRLVANRTRDPLPFLVLEKLGQSVGTMLQEEGALPNDQCLVFLRDVATTLEKLHVHGMCHCDIKPDHVLRGHRGWILIDPGPETNNTSDYFESSTPAGPARDVLALGRTFLAAYLGYEGEIDIPMGDGYDIEDSPRLVHAVRRMLKKTPYCIQSANDVRRLASRVLAEEFGISSRRYPVHRYRQDH